MKIPAKPTHIPHSFLRLNQRGGRGSRVEDFPQMYDKQKLKHIFINFRIDQKNNEPLTKVSELYAQYSGTEIELRSIGTFVWALSDATPMQ